MPLTDPYQLRPLGDAALVIDFGNLVDEELNNKVVALYHYFTEHAFPGMIEAAPAYSSLMIYYDIFSLRTKAGNEDSVFDYVKRITEELMAAFDGNRQLVSRNISLPACYNEQYGTELAFTASQKKLSVEEIIQLHTSRTYHVYMLGFLPGFAYMGEIDERLEMARKSQPMTVEPGSIGIAGRQTGIYPLRSPGGWQIIGRTPIKLFDADAQEQVLLRTGDKVRFVPVSNDEFDEITSGRRTWTIIPDNS